MPTYTVVVVFDANDADAALALIGKTIDLFPENTLVDEQLRDPDGNIIDHRTQG
jgi:hypothetical protein